MKNIDPRLVSLMRSPSSTRNNREKIYSIPKDRLDATNKQIESQISENEKERINSMNFVGLNFTGRQ